MSGMLETRLLAMVILISMAYGMHVAAQDEVEIETYELPGGVILEMLRIPAGTFSMGSETGQSDEVPVHEVEISRTFLLGKFELTKEQWSAVMDHKPWLGQEFVSDHPKSPAVYLNFQDCQDFIAALNELTGESFRLPTEAEWEYACRAGSTTAFSFGDEENDLSNYGWSRENSSYTTQKFARQVGLLEPNAFGLYDMHGNAGEWCQDYYKYKYPTAEKRVDPTGPKSGFARVVRGGSWAGAAKSCRCTNREEFLPVPRRHDRTLRLAK